MNRSSSIAPRSHDDWHPLTVEFPRGLFGFEKVKRFNLVRDPAQAPFHWLEIADQPGQSFLVVSPEEVLGAYQPEMSSTDAAFLKIGSLSEARVMALVSRTSERRATLNLKSPLIINVALGLGKQIIPRNVSAFTSRYPVALGES